MYRTVIQIKSDVADSTLRQLKNIIEMAFSNRVGTVANISNEPRLFSFVGGEEAYACLEVGLLNLKRNMVFLNCVHSWKWIEDDPTECCDMLEVFSKPVK